MSTSKNQFKFAGIQLLVGDNKEENLQRAQKKIKEAAASGADVVTLPEMFNCPYSNDSFGPYSENIPDGPSYKMLSQAAKENKIYLIGGSIPERDNENKLYNTCLIFNRDGNLIGKHRKMHLFDVDIPGRITFQESKTLSPGNQITMIETGKFLLIILTKKEFCKIGVAICYDIRFPEYALLCMKQGAKMLVYPGAFNMTTGPAHWEILQKARAVDCQLYVSAVSPARNPKISYQAWGHTTVVAPWGNILATTEHDEDIVYANIDLTKADEMRQQIPTSKQKRNDIYVLTSSFANEK